MKKLLAMAAVVTAMSFSASGASGASGLNPFGGKVVARKQSSDQTLPKPEGTEQTPPSEEELARRQKALTVANSGRFVSRPAPAAKPPVAPTPPPATKLEILADVSKVTRDGNMTLEKFESTYGKRGGEALEKLQVGLYSDDDQ
jgi:hypothetical protein